MLCVFKNVDLNDALKKSCLLNKIIAPIVHIYLSSLALIVNIGTIYDL